MDELNYLKEILTFENWLDYNSNLNKSDIRLWYTLMYTANRFNWKEFFEKEFNIDLSDFDYENEGTSD